MLVVVGCDKKRSLLTSYASNLLNKLFAIQFDSQK